MRSSKILSRIAGLFGLFVLGPSFGQSPGAGSETIAGQATTDIGGVRLYTGVRLWVTNWEIYSVEPQLIPDPNNPGSVLIQTLPAKHVAQIKAVPIPIVGFRAGNFVGSASYFPRTSYDSRDSSLGTVDRYEYDATLGYAVLPSLVVSLVYKHAYQNKFSNQIPGDIKINALLLGASGSLPFTDNLSLYGNAAYGFSRIKSSGDLADETTYSGSYRIGEVGISYAVYSGTQDTVLKNVSLTFGYRAQVLLARSVGFGTATLAGVPVDIQKKDVQTTTDGFVLGIVGSF
jgi:hypothetical protein